MIDTVMLMSGGLLLLLLLMSDHAGSWLRARLRPAPFSEMDERRAGLALATNFSLLAFLLGFTFNLAMARFEARRDDVVMEASAIGAAHYSAAFINTPQGAALQAELRRYAELRLRHGEAGPAERLTLSRESARQRDVIGRAGQAAVASATSAPLGTAMIAGLNDVFDAGVHRESVLNSRLPAVVFVLLTGFSAVAMATLGYVHPQQRWLRLGPAGIMFLLFTLTLSVIIDLDRPASGNITISQQPMADLVAELRAATPVRP